MSDISIWSLIAGASLPVQLVMLLLLAMSIPIVTHVCITYVYVFITRHLCMNNHSRVYHKPIFVLLEIYVLTSIHVNNTH